PRSRYRLCPQSLRRLALAGRARAAHRRQALSNQATRLPALDQRGRLDKIRLERVPRGQPLLAAGAGRTLAIHPEMREITVAGEISSYSLDAFETHLTTRLREVSANRITMTWNIFLPLSWDRRIKKEG